MIDSADIFNGKILIVDDHAANIVLLERMLRGAGYISVSSTQRATEVCALHIKHCYDLILLDLVMPGMDGFQLMEDLKKIETEGYLPVLVISAEHGHMLPALKAGAKDFISKPFDLAEVLARVHNMLEVRLLHLESKKLYEQLMVEQQHAFALAAMPGIMVGVEKEEHSTTHWWRSLWLRHPWLQVNLFTALLGGGVVLLFQDTIDQMLVLAVFIPVLISQACNTGSQALAITLRALDLRELKPGKEKLLIIKEALLGLLNGALAGVVAAAAMYMAATFQGLPIADMLSVVVFFSMTGSCVISSICGAVVPLTLRKFGADPATASSIVLTTVTDVAGLVLLLGLASILI